MVFFGSASCNTSAQHKHSGAHSPARRHPHSCQTCSNNSPWGAARCSWRANVADPVTSSSHSPCRGSDHAAVQDLQQGQQRLQLAGGGSVGSQDCAAIHRHSMLHRHGVLGAGGAGTCWRPAAAAAARERRSWCGALRPWHVKAAAAVEAVVRQQVQEKRSAAGVNAAGAAPHSNSGVCGRSNRLWHMHAPTQMGCGQPDAGGTVGLDMLYMHLAASIYALYSLGLHLLYGYRLMWCKPV